MLDAHRLLWTQIAAGVCLLNFGDLLFRLVRLRGETRAAGKWDRVEGVIIASEVDQPPAHVSDDETVATPVIRYRYRINGNDLEGDRNRLGGVPMTTRLLAMQQVARYPLGARVDVYVNPKNPKRALLEPRAQNNIVGTVVFAVVFGVIALVLTAHRVLYAANGVPLFAFALPGVTVLIAILGIVSFVRARQLARASTRWPSVSGTVTTSSVREGDRGRQRQGQHDQAKDPSLSCRSAVRLPGERTRLRRHISRFRLDGVLRRARPSRPRQVTTSHAMRSRSSTIRITPTPPYWSRTTGKAPLRRWSSARFSPSPAGSRWRSSSRSGSTTRGANRLPPRQTRSVRAQIIRKQKRTMADRRRAPFEAPRV